MHIRPAKNRIRAMTIGYLAGLPAVFLLCRLDFLVFGTQTYERTGVILFHAYFLHLLIFLLYAECFYHIERAVTLRLLLEIQNGEDHPGSAINITREYNAEEMVRRRLDVLESHAFVERRGESWMLRRKGRVFARLMQFSSWLFQSANQWDMS